MFNMSVVVVALPPSKSYCYFYSLMQNGVVYTAAELPRKQIAKSDDLYIFVTHFESAISCIQCFVFCCVGEC